MTKFTSKAAAQRFHSFVEMPTEYQGLVDLFGVELQRKCFFEFRRLTHLTDWLLLWLLAGGTRDCGESYVTYLEATLLLVADQRQSPELYDGVSSGFPLPALNSAGFRDFIDDSYTVPVAIHQDVFDVIARLANGERRRKIRLLDAEGLEHA